MTLKEQFVKRSLALKGGKSKKEYVAQCAEKGLKARYSGKVVRDSEGKILRHQGFYLTPIG